ncbi:MAG: hypothetical protein ABIG63_08085 [Chloroflexota bacterium]
MRDWGQVIGWLNEYDRSHLDDECRALFTQISDTTISESQRDDLINDVIQVGRSKSDPLIYPEVLVLCSEYFFKRDRFTEARKYLNEAKDIYLGFERSGRHRLFVTLWLLGIVEWKMVTHYAAHWDWKNATEIVNEIAEEEKGGPYDEMAQWYKEREEEMKVSLAGTAEETYTWLIFSKTGLFGNLRGKPEIPKEPETSYLSSELIQWRDAMIMNIRDEKYGQAYLDIQNLTEIVNKRSSRWEKAEIELACGLALHQMQNHEAAEIRVIQAVNIFFPYTHRVAVARWMLGIIQWKNESKRSEALNNWRKSIDDFSSLLERANTENKKDRVKWYTNACAVLERAMEQRIPY